MRSIFSWVLGLGGVVFIVIGLVGFVLMRMNSFEEYGVQYSGICTPVVGVPGVEDIAADEARNIAWLSSMDRRAKEQGEDIRGAIVAFDPANPLDNASWQDRTGLSPDNFEPLGIDLYEQDGLSRLFVVNRAEPSVLIYDIDRFGNLALLETKTFRWLTNPNSVVAVGPNAFYVSNSTTSSPESLSSSVDFLFGNATGSIFYYDGNSWNVAAENLRFANGLALSQDRKQLFVAETAGKKLRLYHRDIETGILSRHETLKLDSFPDNLHMGVDGDLVIGAIPKPLAFSRLVQDAGAMSPSQIIRVKMREGEPLLQEVLYQNDGKQLSGTTSAAKIGTKLLIGAFADNKFLLCD